MRARSVRRALSRFREPRVVVTALFALTIAVTLANAWMVLHRHEGYFVRQLSYETLYSPAEALRIAGFERHPNALVVRIEPVRAGDWEIRSDEMPALVRGPHPRIALRAGLHTYRLAQRGRELSLTVLHDPSAGQVAVLDASVPVGDFARQSLAEQAARLDDYSAADVARGRRILARIGLPSGGTRERIERLMAHIVTELDAHRGTPSYEMMRVLSPLAQYDRARAGREQVFCANFAQIYSFFATLARIPTREVSIVGERDGVALGGHTFNESFIAERGEWAYVDVTFQLGLVETPERGYLDGLELARVHRLGMIDGLRASVVVDGHVERAPYAEHARFTRAYVHRDATYLYHRSMRDRYSAWGYARRMLFAPDSSWAATGADRFYLKSSGLALQFLLGAVWLFLGLRWIARRRRLARAPISPAVRHAA